MTSPSDSQMLIDPKHFGRQGFEEFYEPKIHKVEFGSSQINQEIPSTESQPLTCHQSEIPNRQINSR